MTYSYIVLEPTAGQTLIIDERIRFRRLLDVNREGVGFDIIGAPSLFDERNVINKSWQGSLKFKVPFGTGEKVNVLIVE